MPEGEGARKGDERQDNLFKIIDGIVCQLERTKKIFLVLLVAVAVIPPVSLVLTQVTSPPLPGEGHHGDGLAGTLSFLLSTRNVPLWTSVVGIGIAVWQWFSLSWWTRRYRRYKKKRDEVERNLDREFNDDSQG